MNPPPEAPTLWKVDFGYTSHGSVICQGFQYDNGTYFFYLPDREILAVSMEAVEYVRITPVPQGNDIKTAFDAAVSEQAENQRRERPVQTSRWQLP